MRIIFLIGYCLLASFAPVYSMVRVKRFHTDALKIHNYARFLHDSMPLTLSVFMCDTANDTAAEILEKLQNGENFLDVKLKVRTLLKEEGDHYLDMMGENTWTKETPAPAVFEDDIDEDGSDLLKNAISDWYSEIDNYKWTVDQFDKETDKSKYMDSIQGFAQLIWNTTMEVGCGYARDYTRIVIVCHYHPLAILSNFKLLSVHVPSRVRPNEFSTPEFKVKDDLNPKPPIPGKSSAFDVPDYTWLGDIAKGEILAQNKLRPEPQPNPTP